MATIQRQCQQTYYEGPWKVNFIALLSNSLVVKFLKFCIMIQNPHSKFHIFFKK